MSATSDDTDRRSIAELRQMDESTAMQSLTMAEFKRWESVNDHHERAAEVREEWRENEEAVDEILRNNDVSALAAEVELFGNECLVYYDPEDSRFRDIVDEIEKIDGVDFEGDTETRAEEIDMDDIGPLKSGLAELIGLSLIEWNGHVWDNLAVATRTDIVEQIQQSRPDGWGLAGLMDAWTEIQVSVESKRDERLGRIEKFRNEKRRGDR